MNSSNEPSEHWRRWSNLQSRIRADKRDLALKTALALFITGAVMIALVLCA